LTGAGYMLKVPSIDLAEVGAGGGSLVRIDDGGSLRVGPESAGASPGPVCYDLGGANLVLGYINPDHLVGGALRLNAVKAHAAFEQKVAKPLGLPLERAAYGAHQIAASNMIRAIRAVSTERGRDPRDFAMFAFGGSGPIFAAGMARDLSMRQVMIPPSPGLFSSFGLLYADIEHHYARTFRCLLREARLGELNRLWQELAEDVGRLLAAEGLEPARIRIDRAASLRYQGQSFELTVPAPEGPLDGSALRGLEEAFGLEHERTYGHRAGPEEPVELVTLGVVGRAVSERSRRPERIAPRRSDVPGQSSHRRAYFGPKAGWLETPVLSRAALTTSHHGPLIVEEYDATCVVPPSAQAMLDAHGNIVITLN
jgi:N-methylhydantoinase A